MDIITSTQLKQNTKDILDKVENGEPMIVETYGRPKVVIVDFKQWQRMKVKPNLDALLRDHSLKGITDTDSTRTIRAWRDAE